MDTNNNLSLIAVLVLSAAGLVGIAVDEGYTQKAVPDAVKGTAVPTIGFGTTGGVKMGDTTTPVKALQRKLSDIKSFEGALHQCVRVPLHQYEYDAYINLAYNIGPTAFCNSTLVKRLNARDYAGACGEILKWRFVGAVDCASPGNTRYQTAEAAGLSRKQVSAVFDSLGEQIRDALGKKGAGTFTVPGLMRINVINKPATKARKGINPFTKEEQMFKAKPARKVVKVRPLKNLKEMAK